MYTTEKSEKLRKMFGENLRRLRVSRGYSQIGFAKVLGTTQASVSAWELGIREPDIGVVFGIADQFKVPVTSLIPIEESGLNQDVDQRAMDMIHINPRWRVTFDKTKNFDDKQMNIVLSVIDAIAKESGDQD